MAVRGRVLKLPRRRRRRDTSKPPIKSKDTLAEKHPKKKPDARGRNLTKVRMPLAQ